VQPGRRRTWGVWFLFFGGFIMILAVAVAAARAIILGATGVDFPVATTIAAGFVASTLSFVVGGFLHTRESTEAPPSPPAPP
jgi:hypothetical protein